MEKTLPLYLGPSVIGSVVCCYNGEELSLFAKTYASLPGICRAYVQGTQCKLLIGVLAPDGSAFSATKKFSKSSLASGNISFDNITYACAQYSSKKETPEIYWQNADPVPELLRRDNVVSSLANSSGALVDDVNTPAKLAVPLITGRPFPRPDILCLLTPCEINGVLYGVLGISSSGSPERL